QKPLPKQHTSTGSGGKLQLRAYAYIVPAIPCSVDENGWPRLTAQLTDVEIDGNIQALKADLDRVGKRAKSALRRVDKRTQKRLDAERERRENEED
ncbi:MAG: hypothetical protein OXC54_08940, partial [Rhodospirillaceae bacterium]|nr:hypothetical protein [Rhodospirillaceae bacterium]MCY4311416.1 hypothetical protein [Rhodospirillaceae bacterium]